MAKPILVISASLTYGYLVLVSHPVKSSSHIHSPPISYSTFISFLSLYSLIKNYLSTVIGPASKLAGRALFGCLLTRKCSVPVGPRRSSQRKSWEPEDFSISPLRFRYALPPITDERNHFSNKTCLDRYLTRYRQQPTVSSRVSDED